MRPLSFAIDLDHTKTDPPNPFQFLSISFKIPPDHAKTLSAAQNPFSPPESPRSFPNSPPRSPGYSQLFALQSENVFIRFCVQLYQHDTHKLAHNVLLVISMGPISLGCYRFGPHKKQIPPTLSNSLYILQDPTRSLEDSLRRPNPKSLTHNHLSHSQILSDHHHIPICQPCVAKLC
jgi:hypothetical protein